MGGADPSVREAWLTKGEARKALRVSPPILNRYVEQGMIRAYTPPQARTRLLRADVEKLIEQSMKVNATAGV